MDLEALRDAKDRVANDLFDFLADIDIGEQALGDLQELTDAAVAILGSERRWWCSNPRPEKCSNERGRQIGLRISERDPGLGVDHSECGFVYVVPA